MANTQAGPPDDFVKNPPVVGEELELIGEPNKGKQIIVTGYADGYVVFEDERGKQYPAMPAGILNRYAKRPETA